MSDTSKFDSLARRLRARVERSVSREQSLDWKAANAIDHLQAECERLTAEARSLRRESEEAERHAVTVPPQPPADVGVPEPHAASTAAALGLQEAADLLNVSYSTVFANRRDLGFFQVGRQWRIWPETLREEMGRRAKKSSSADVRIDPSLPPDRISPLRRQTLSPSARQAAKELDELLKILKPAAARRQSAARLPDPLPSARQAKIRAEYEELVGISRSKPRKKT
ncbi:helix-turn-helix domain-containing protein [Burkholderia cenocepacia]|uniref:helix-turn-helix domain-containing protein n=1 Tax=Burkholderia cenocepacia TaxID=95486 RepID=UPI002875A728|nr:helix-turn-helix domain-containing protein [Burkholderia cenocepacia]MDS0802827.1 helix-turn-helix domain-containing protein [Burkholderia cenocepacia]